MKRSFRIVFAVIFVLLFALTLVGCKEVKVGINFVVDNQIYHTINTKGEEAIELPKAPQKEGYVFQGWFWDKDVWRQPFTINSLLNQPLEEMVDVYAYFITVEEAESNKTVTFNTMGGGTTPSQTVKKGSAVTEPEGVTKTGYILVGWYREADYTTKWDFVADRVQEDLTLYAKWVPESDMAGAEIIEAGDFAVEGKTLSIRTPNADQTFSFSEQIQVSPYAVYKICIDRACTQEIPSGIVDLQVGSNTFYIMITSGNGSNKTVYTAEIYRRHMFSVTYRYNNGTADKVIEAEEDSLLSPEDPGSKTGYDFVGWSDWDFESDVVSGSMTLDAVWEEAVYKISFQTEGGSEINPTEVRYQSDYQWSVPEKRGYDFLGWKDGDTMLTDAVGQSLAAWTKAQDTTVTAAWEAIEYTIDYANLKGADNPNPTAYTIEDEVTFAPVAQAGYRFEAWHDEEGTVIDGIARGSIGNRTVEAVWEILEYTATFVIEGEEVATRTFTVETESIEEPAIPEKIGYTRAWEPYAFVADDITIHAVYTPIVYNIVYMVSGAYDVDTPVNTNPTSYTIGR